MRSLAAPSGEAPSEVVQAPEIKVPPPRLPSTGTNRCRRARRSPAGWSPRTDRSRRDPDALGPGAAGPSGRGGAAGRRLVLRVLALMAYHPALLYTDTLKYLYGAWPGADPVGYTVILKPILLLRRPGHGRAGPACAGPGDGGRDLRAAGSPGGPPLARPRRRWRRFCSTPTSSRSSRRSCRTYGSRRSWWPAWCCCSGGRNRTLWIIAGAGLIFGASATIRQIGLILVMPALLYLAAATTSPAAGDARGADPAGDVRAAGRWPTAGSRKVQAGHFNLSDEGSIAGRIAATRRTARRSCCPADERPLCPTPGQQANGIDWLEHSRQSPVK